MTSEEYARAYGQRLLAVARATSRDTNGTAYRRAFTLGVSRIMFEGAEQYEDNGVQSVEVKPLGELVRDIEEEAVDLIAYATALQMRAPEHAAKADDLIALAMRQMDVVAEIIEPA